MFSHRTPVNWLNTGEVETTTAFSRVYKYQSTIPANHHDFPTAFPEMMVDISLSRTN
jgi:hypothetical protein